MYYLLVGLYVLICLLLLVVVLLQQGKGGDIAAAFGGSSSQTAFGARAGATFLTRATAVLATLFMVGAFALSVMGHPGGSSVVSGVKGPAQTAAPTLPMNSPVPTTPPAGAAPTPTTPPAAADKGKTPDAPKTSPTPTPKPGGGRGGV
jgi:preprotein translocase subunit SecG